MQRDGDCYDPKLVGVSASTRLLDTAVGAALRQGWFVRIAQRRRHDVRTQIVQSMREVSAALSDRQIEAGGSSVYAQVHPHETGAFVTPGCDSLYAVTCLSVAVRVPWLFRRGEPLFEPELVNANGEVEGGALGAGRMQRARRFAVDHAKRLVFRPSAALASYDSVFLFFLISKPIALLSSDKERVDRVQAQLARLVHGGYPRKIGSWVPLPLECQRNGRRFVRSRLLWARRDIVYDLDRLDHWAHEREHARGERRRGARRQPAPELRLRTLMDDYELRDLDLPPAMRQLIAAGSSSSRTIVLDELPLLVDAMARAGYGFEDLRVVLSDTRFPLAYSARIEDSHRRGLGLRFSRAVRDAVSAYPPRLPYGISSIVRDRDEGDLTVDRYVVRGGTKGAPFTIEVSHDILISARRFHRALATHLKTFPYRVPQEVWEEIVLRRGLCDPRIVLGRRRRTEADPVPLAERIGAFASEAKPLEPWLWESGESIPWPVLRDGQVVFRLAVLRERLAAEIEGPAPGRSEVTAAVRAAGGAPFGAMRFGERVIRVWTLPYPGRQQAAHGGGRA